MSGVNKPEPRQSGMRQLLFFSIIVVSCGWLGRFVDIYAGTDENGSLGQLIWIVTPVIAMIALRSFTADGWKDFGWRLNLRGNAGWYAGSILFYPAIGTTVVLVCRQMGWLSGEILSYAFMGAVAASLLPSLAKNVFEEFAWRGYLAPRLLTMGHHRLFAHAYTGVIWGAWHFPYLHLFVETSEAMLTFIPRLLLGMIVVSIVYGEIRWRTNSVWPAVLMHTFGNAFIDTMILKTYIIVDPHHFSLAMPSPEGLLTIGDRKSVV